MTVACDDRTGVRQIVLSGSVDVLEIGDVQAALREGLAANVVIAVDVARLTHADLTLPQLLMIARRELAKRGGELALTGTENAAWSNLLDSALLRTEFA